MAENDLKVGQLLSIKEKNGKLIREYVAGFFGDQPIIKQRLLTPQEARIYREDLEKGKKSGKTGSEAAREAQGAGPGVPVRRAVRKPAAGTAAAAKPGMKKPGMKKRLVRKPAAGAASASEAETGTAGTAPLPAKRKRADQDVEKKETAAYFPQASANDESFLRNLINSEEDKPDYKPDNFIKALDAIRKIGSPDMKIFRIGSSSDDKEGEFYKQKEYLARDILGLPIWKELPASEKTEEAQEPQG